MIIQPRRMTESISSAKWHLLVLAAGEPELPWYAAINQCIGPLSDGSAIFEYTCNNLVTESRGKASFHLHSSPVCVIEDAPVLPKDGKDSFIARRVGPRLPGSST